MHVIRLQLTPSNTGHDTGYAAGLEQSHNLCRDDGGRATIAECDGGLGDRNHCAKKVCVPGIRLGHQVEGAERFEIWVSLITKVARRGLVKAQVGKLTGRDGYRIRRFAQVHDSGPKFNPHWAIEGPRDLVDLLTVGFRLIYLRRDVLRQGFADGRLLPSV